MSHPSPSLPTRPDLDALYVTILNEELERRQRDHGHAFLTPADEAWLKAHGLRRTQRYADLGPLSDSARQPQPIRPFARP